MSIDLLLADLHLPPLPGDGTAGPLNRAFREFCDGPARQARRVFVLGDLFEVWVGDDAGLVEHADDLAALRRLSDAGVEVYLQHGNRDFIVGRAFAEATGMRLLPDLAVFEIGGERSLLAHGDLFCTDDAAYQRWRRFSRNPLAQWLYSRLPLARRRRIAGGLRSDEHKQRKPDSIMDVNEAAIRRAFVSAGTRRMIHGHTHRPAEHRYPIDGHDCERIVLADWRPGRLEYLQADAQGWRRVLLPSS